MGPHSYSRFGFALAVLDINQDGIDDLIVSAPAFGAGGPTGIYFNNYTSRYPKKYDGSVYIYLGVNGTGIPLGASPSLTI